MAKNTKGLDVVLKNLNMKVEKLGGATLDGLLAGGVVVQGTAMRYVPVEFGKLRESAYTRRAQEMETRGKVMVEVGFSIYYAPYVHENLEMRLKGQKRPSGLGVYWGPRGRSRFLAEAVEEKTEKVVEIVANRLKKAMSA